ncbi:hypothetical protein Tsubulata_031145 [Turnera subulata]|uniref:EamA domain-containing protein n=1 Tax=Turnera subulata TaxID=218843 RepID=A0A9Q0FGB9_9ROSI|nr:hypothetical protein Tsubulata_031145 [Turnera subulata]
MWVSKVTAVMLAVEFLEVGMNTVNKAAMRQGLNDFILVVYSNFLAIFLLLFACFIFYRNRTLPPLSWPIIGRIFLLGLLSCSGQVFTYVGISYSSPTLASAMIDLTPAFTFLLAIMSRMEKIDLRFGSSQAKSIGTVGLIAGGLVVTLYKGVPLIISTPSSNIMSGRELLLPLPLTNWAIGGFFLALHSLILALIYIIMTWITRDYPAELVVTLISSFFVTILSALVSLVAVKDPNDWRVSPNMELIAVIYSAVFAITLRTTFHTWACHKKGPVYTAMFKPLGMVIAALMGVSFLGDTLYLGSVVGAVIIVFGFYAVIWGKAKEEKIIQGKEVSSNFESSSPKAPFLEKKSNEHMAYNGRSDCPPLNLSSVCSFFLLASIGYSGLIFGYAGIQYSSPTLNTAMLNLIPGFTFVLALIFRMERVDLKSSSSIAKLVGTVVSLIGAFIVTFYKGLPITFKAMLSSNQILFSPQENWILGGFLSAAHSMIAALWYTFQASVLEKYPKVLIVLFFYCFFVTLQSLVVCLILEDLSAWKLKPDIGLVAVVHSAIIGTVFRYSMSMLCVRTRGPLYVSMFKPLGIVFAAIMSVMFLGEALHVGSLVGAIVISAGFYAFMWGKSKEGRNTGEETRAAYFQSSRSKEPLLQNAK